MSIRKVDTGYPEPILVGNREVDQRFNQHTVVLKTQTRDGVVGLTPPHALNLAAALVETALEVSRQDLRE